MNDSLIKALAHNTFAILSDSRHLVKFDRVVQTMNQTGKDLSLYKETAEGGLALFSADIHNGE